MTSFKCQSKLYAYDGSNPFTKAFDPVAYLVLVATIFSNLQNSKSIQALIMHLDYFKCHHANFITW